MENSDWRTSTRNPANICRFIRGLGLVTIFRGRNGKYTFAYSDGLFSDPYATQEAAQQAAEQLAGLHSSAPIQA